MAEAKKYESEKTRATLRDETKSKQKHSKDKKSDKKEKKKRKARKRSLRRPNIISATRETKIRSTK